MEGFSFSGASVSLRESAELSGGIWRPLDPAHQVYDWAKRVRLDAELGVATLRNVVVNHVWQIFLPDHGICVLDETYPNALTAFPMPHERTDGAFRFSTDKPLERRGGAALLLGGHNNHWHMLANWLPRLFIAGAAAPNLKFDALVLNRDFNAFMFEFLRAAGFGDVGRITMRNVFNQNRTLLRFDELHVPSFISNRLLLPGAIAWMRGLADKHAPGFGPALTAKGLYASRENEPRHRRRVRNAEEVETVLRRFGLEPRYCDEMSFKGQIRAFRDASIIVGPHGAQLANIMFAREGTPFVLFEYKARGEYEGLAELIGLRCVKMLCPQTDEPDAAGAVASAPRLRDFVVDAQQLEAALARFVR